MTREEIISEIKGLLAELDNGADAVSYLTQNDTKWLVENIKALEQEPCEDCISREQAKVEIRKAFPSLAERVDINSILNGLPSVKQEPKTGHWIAIDEEPHEDYECDKCGYVVSTYTANIEPHTEYKFCPNCGAKMERGE